MGRKSRNKHHATALAAKKRRVPADDYFRRGPFEMARFGKHVVMRNNMTPEQHEEYLRLLADDLPSVTAAIDAHVAAIVRIVRSYDPLSLLQRGYWDSVMPHIMSSDGLETKEGVVGQRMVDYIQSILAAVAQQEPPLLPVTEEAWTELRTHVEALFDTINQRYLMSRTAHWKVNGGGPPDDQVEFYARALVMWCNVSGDRYHFQEIDYLRELISPHSDEFLRIWGIDAEGILKGLAEILHSLTRGLGEAMKRITELEQEFLEAKASAAGDEAAFQRRLDELRAQPGTQESFGRLFGVDLFRVDPYLPNGLLADLSWAQGQCKEFVDGRPQSGWPTRVWPRSRRPFLEINGAHYCFDVHTLFDHIYRVLERTIRTKDPSYTGVWNERQKAASEQMPFTLFSKLLPDAATLRSVYYEVDEVDALGRKKWCELDGLITFIDHLFIIEVKGGAFTAASPEDGVDSYLKSIERLVFAPVDQGSRFLRWLERQGEVELCDHQHRLIGKLSRRDFNHVTLCAISLDPFTELSAKAFHLQKLVGRKDAVPFWALSVSDLLTYSELFENPLVFLHFVEKRNQATASSKVVLDDELDHYGMYLQHNNYDLHAEGFSDIDRMGWIGYRREIDQYFNARTRGEPATLPRQKMPDLVARMIDSLSASRHPRRREVASMLLDCDGDTRADIERSLLRTLELQAELHRPRPFSIGGRDVRITFACWQENTIQPEAFDAAEHCKMGMLAAAEPNRWLIELHFDKANNLRAIEPTQFTAVKIAEEEARSLAQGVKWLRDQRITQKTRESGKIGRNQLCPCGSGKKFKRCCGA